MNVSIKPKSKRSQSRKDIPLSETARRFWNESLLQKPFSWPTFEAILHDEETSWIPRADYSETNKGIKIKIDIPNVEPDRLSVEVDDHSLHISGSTEKEEQEEGETWYRAERSWGEFKRVFSIPTNVDTHRIEAESKNGTLFIKIPKLKIESKKKISVAKK